MPVGKGLGNHESTLENIEQETRNIEQGMEVNHKPITLQPCKRHMKILFDLIYIKLLGPFCCF